MPASPSLLRRTLMPAPRPSSGTQRTHLPLGCSMSMKSRTTRTKFGSKWRGEGGRREGEREREGEGERGKEKGRDGGERAGEKEVDSRGVEGGRKTTSCTCSLPLEIHFSYFFFFMKIPRQILMWLPSLLLPSLSFLPTSPSPPPPFPSSSPLLLLPSPPPSLLPTSHLPLLPSPSGTMTPSSRCQSWRHQRCRNTCVRLLRCVLTLWGSVRKASLTLERW